MATCPFLDRECLRDACQLWAPGIGNCCLVATTILMEDMQRLGVVAYDRFLKVPDKQAAAAKAMPAQSKPADTRAAPAAPAEPKKTPPPPKAG